ncbi:Calcineurin B-like protein 7, variant 3 [Stylosanthes scabra]|uniref:Calcineurin B-like protein n=1 Tax=Stylosanthes scabra TaxID=79078 RepID=A0ABU6VF34_9FABA|nr:Calcineurin B-like protein 7, variant 3 [Stylosanthes scabra]
MTNSSCLLPKHPEQLQFALLRNSSKQNLFVDRLFDMFDIKRNGVIEFSEFVRSLSIFHPSASPEKKIEFAFRLFDIRQSGYIGHNELKEMVLATLTESDVTVPDDVVESIVEKVHIPSHIHTYLLSFNFFIICLNLMFQVRYFSDNKGS